MTYTANVPTASPRQSLNQSRPLINTNFSLIQAAFDQDHIDFDASGAGKHTAVHFPANANPTQASTNVGEIAIYSKDDTDGNPQLVMREPDDGTEQQISGPVNTGKGALLQGGSAPLFGGFLMLFGQKALSAGSNTIDFTTECGINFGAGGKCYNVQAISLSALGSVSINSVTASGFKAQSSGTPTIYFTAIGKRP